MNRDPARDRPAGSTRWLALSLPAPSPGEAILLVEALRGLGARSVERERGGDGVVAIFPAPTDVAVLVADAIIAVRASTTLGDVTPRWRWLSSSEWEAWSGGGHPPRRVSDRLVVVVGEPAAGAPGGGGAGEGEARLIRLEPSAAFGTGEHPTTRACLAMLDRVVAEGDRVLDVGAGSGVLAIGAVVLGAVSALALESDPVACEAARRNVALNGVGDRVRIRQRAVAPGSPGTARRYDGIVANIGADVLRSLLPDLTDALAPGGWIILSGVIPAERQGLVAAARSVGLDAVEESVVEGWWTGRLEAVGAGGAGR